MSKCLTSKTTRALRINTNYKVISIIIFSLFLSSKLPQAKIKLALENKIIFKIGCIFSSKL